MEWLWIPMAVFAALMQAVRTAGQKTLNQRMSTMGTTYVRSLFGLPVLLVYLAGVLAYRGGGLPDFSAAFLGHVFVGALTQVLATALLIQMFKLKNFAVGTLATKTDIVMTALIGTALFSERLTAMGWLALFVVLAGVLLMLMGRLAHDGFGAGGGNALQGLFGKPTRVALLCALLFTFSYLFLREATLDLGQTRPLWRGAWTVVTANLMSVVGLGIWLALFEPAIFSQLWPNRALAAFIGLTSALGSIGWFTAFALQNASYVRAVGQIEAVFTLAISWVYFRERITALEFAGIALTLAGVAMFRLL